jgi:hypothetical protein
LAAFWTDGLAGIRNHWYLFFGVVHLVLVSVICFIIDHLPALPELNTNDLKTEKQYLHDQLRLLNDGAMIGVSFSIISLGLLVYSASVYDDACFLLCRL